MLSVGDGLGLVYWHFLQTPDQEASCRAGTFTRWTCVTFKAHPKRRLARAAAGSAIVVSFRQESAHSQRNLLMLI